MPPNRHLDQMAADRARADGWIPGPPLVNRIACLLTSFQLTAGLTRRDHPAGRHRLDFAWPAQRLALIAEPPAWRADDGTARLAAEADAELRRLGWVVFRVGDEGCTAEQFALQVARVARIVHAELGTIAAIRLARSPGSTHGHLKPGGHPPGVRSRR